MIKVNVEINNRSWRKEIKNPKKYFSEKLKKINLQVSKLVKQKWWHLFKTKRRKKNKITFNILLTDSLNMKRLNKQFLRKYKSTDVLSFPFLSSNNLKFSKQKKFYIGDVATSYEIISSRSKKNNFLLEFDKVWIHGLLHLLGFDHKRNKDYFKMNRLEKRFLNLVC